MLDVKQESSNLVTTYGYKDLQHMTRIVLIISQVRRHHKCSLGI